MITSIPNISIIPCKNIIGLPDPHIKAFGEVIKKNRYCYRQFFLCSSFDIDNSLLGRNEKLFIFNFFYLKKLGPF